MSSIGPILGVIFLFLLMLAGCVFMLRGLIQHLRRLATLKQDMAERVLRLMGPLWDSKGFHIDVQGAIRWQISLFLENLLDA